MRPLWLPLLPRQSAQFAECERALAPFPKAPENDQGFIKEPLCLLELSLLCVPGCPDRGV